jgi:hypothetical protein
LAEHRGWKTAALGEPNTGTSVAARSLPPKGV